MCPKTSSRMTRSCATGSRQDCVVSVSMKFFRTAPAFAALLLACSTRQPASEPTLPAFIPHSQWEAQPPLGYAADATRRNIAASGSLSFRDFRIDVLSTAVDSTGGSLSDVVNL